MVRSPNWEWFRTVIPGGFPSAFEVEVLGEGGGLDRYASGFGFTDTSGTLTDSQLNKPGSVVPGYTDVGQQFPTGGFIGPSGAAAWGLAPGEPAGPNSWLNNFPPAFAPATDAAKAPATGSVTNLTSSAPNLKLWILVGVVLLLLLLRR